MTANDLAFPPVHFRDCPACPARLADHLYADREITDQAIQAEDYVRSLDELEPVDVVRTYPAAKAGARMALRLLQCPNGGAVVAPVLLAESPMGEDQCVGMTLSLSPADADKLAMAVGDGWQPYAARWATGNQR